MALPFLLSLCLLFGLSDGGVMDGSEHDVHGHHKDFDWDKAPTCKEGKRQSPVNLVTADAICMGNTSDFRFDNFKQSGPVQVGNNGHTGYILGFIKWANRPMLVRTDLRFRYFLQQIHFHWDMYQNGSEHAIDGNLSTAEMHLVFSLGDMSLTKAKNTPKGLVVVGILLEVMDGKKLGISEDMTRVKDDGKTTWDDHFNLTAMIKENVEHFRYDGSLTTPDCDENVHWIVYKDKMGMAQSELAALRSLYDKEHFTIDSNHREVQSINKREVHFHSPNCKK